MVVDSSALVAILLLEDDAEALAERIRLGHQPRISAANLTETLIVLNRRNGTDNRPEVHDFVVDSGMVVEPVNLAQAWLAGEAYRRFGKGHHRARLNYGDCFAYALARSLDLPLLFKGDDFRHTDIRPAL
jgi:ribonuclease VapC